MEKGSRGGQRAGGLTSGAGNIQPTINAQQPQVDDTQQASAFSTDYNSFMAMSDDDKADVISNAISQGVPAHLSQSDFQKFVYNSGLNDKPDVVDDATLDSMSGTEIFRTVNQVYDPKNDVNYNADEIIDQIQNGDVTRFSDTGGSAYGRGIYFADSYSESSFYGNTRNSIKQTAVTRAKLNDKAKVISYNQASNGAQAEINSGSSLGKALAKCDRQSQSSIWALSKGYNVISANNSTGYFNILDRSVLTMSKTVKPMSNKW